MIELCRQVLAMLPGQAWSLRIEAVQFMVAAQRLRGDLAAAHDLLDHAMAAPGNRRREAQARLIFADCLLAWMAGNLAGAAASANQVLA